MCYNCYQQLISHRSDNMIRKITCPLEVGHNSNFTGELNEKYSYVREAEYLKPLLVMKFPLLTSTIESELDQCLIINLFLQQKFTGYVNYINVNDNKRNEDSDIKTIEGACLALKQYLEYCIKSDLDIMDGLLNTFSIEQTQWLPPFRYKSHLISRLKDNDLTLRTANQYLAYVRQFYEWAHKTGRIDRIIFKYENKRIKTGGDDDKYDELDLLFSSKAVQSLSKKKSLNVQTSNLTIPAKFRNAAERRKEVEPWSQHDIDSFFATDYMQSKTRRLWANLGFQVGLRAEEIVDLREDVIVDPEISTKTFFQVTVLGKGDKTRKVIIPTKLMKALFEHKNSAQRMSSIKKYKDSIIGMPKHSVEFSVERLKGIPLFVNKQGKRLSRKSITNITSDARKELKGKGITVNDSRTQFHGSRATFLTRIAAAMMEMGFSIGFIRYKLMQLSGHVSFTTTLKHYINLAEGTNFGDAMSGWVNDIYDEQKSMLSTELKVLKEKVEIE